jgi:myosin heavy subunit
MDGAIGAHKHYRGMQNQFQIQHYAGTVTYDAKGFVESNKDTLFKDLIMLAQTTKEYPTELKLVHFFEHFFQMKLMTQTKSDQQQYLSRLKYTIG